MTLQEIARAAAESLPDADRKQLRFNEIVEVAEAFYPNAPQEGVRELVAACDRGSDLYIKGSPMWQSLRENYAWMI
jgi:hypothetical protein